MRSRTLWALLLAAIGIFDILVISGGRPPKTDPDIERALYEIKMVGSRLCTLTIGVYLLILASDRRPEDSR